MQAAANGGTTRGQESAVHREAERVTGVRGPQVPAAIIDPDAPLPLSPRLQHQLKQRMERSERHDAGSTKEEMDLTSLVLDTGTSMQHPVASIPHDEED